MRQPDDDALLVDILIAANEARTIVAASDLDEFLENRLQQLALQKLIEIVGEAASRLTDTTRARLPELPWKDIVGMRHRLVHGYRDVDLAKVWSVAIEDLEPLIGAIEHMLSPDGRPS